MILDFSKFNKHLIFRIIYLTVFATISVIATFLGLGTVQINSEFSYSFNMLNNVITHIIIITITTFVFITTAVFGVDKGIKRVSDLVLMVTKIAYYYDLIVNLCNL